MYVTHKPPVKPDPKLPIPVPSEERLQLLIANGAADVAQQLIDTHCLKYVIENGVLKDSVVGTDLWLKKFITVYQPLVEMKDDIKKLAKCLHEVLIVGETGTGKELIARSMIGDRTGNFIAVNCAGLPENLVESELFGHVKGAFTGAESQKQGMMAAAKEGVIFLDEIGELPLGIQAKLLRALQDKKIRKVGSNIEEDISCKFVCATHRNIKKMVKDGHFRQDLYARISTFELDIPPLRDRECDIIPIIESLVGGKNFLKACGEQTIPIHKLDVSLNVRSLLQAVARYNILGRIVYQERYNS